MASRVTAAIEIAGTLTGKRLSLDSGHRFLFISLFHVVSEHFLPRRISDALRDTQVVAFRIRFNIYGYCHKLTCRFKSNLSLVSMHRSSRWLFEQDDSPPRVDMSKLSEAITRLL